MSGLTDIDALAAEFVLGTLDASERVTVAARLQREVPLQQAVHYWEGRLAPLQGLAQPVEPPANLMYQIERRLGAARKTGVQSITQDSAALQRKLARWRNSAIAAGALAASLAVVLGVREANRPSADQNFVAVFQKDDASPSFVMSVDLATRTLSVRRVSADVPSGKTYQLWIKADELGKDPQSLGLVEGTTTQVKTAIAGIDPMIVQNALFGVSLEPAGGSPTGKPTGPTFHAKLIPTL